MSDPTREQTDYRAQLVEIVTDVLYDIDQALPYAEQAEKIVDAISGRLHAQCAVEQGGLEQVGWGGCQERGVWECDEVNGHEWDLVHEDGTGQLDADHPIWPVYRLTEEAPTDGR